MTTAGSTRGKVVEWTRRYLPCELAGWVRELGAGAVAYWLTGSLAVAVVAVVVGTIDSLAIFSYERFTGLLATPQSRRRAGLQLDSGRI